MLCCTFFIAWLSVDCMKLKLLTPFLSSLLLLSLLYFFIRELLVAHPLLPHHTVELEEGGIQRAALFLLLSSGYCIIL